MYNDFRQIIMCILCKNIPILSINKWSRNMGRKKENLHSKENYANQNEQIEKVSAKKIKKVKKEREKKRKKDKTPQVFMGLTLLSCVMVMVVVGQFFILENQEQNVITKGTSVNGYNIAGMTKENAVTYLGQVFRDNAEQFQLTLNYNNKSWHFDKRDFMVNSDIHTVLDMMQRRESEYGEYSQQLKYLNENSKNINIAFNYLFVGLDEKIEEVIAEIEYEPIDSKITFDTSKSQLFSYTDDKKGLRVDKNALYERINSAFLKSNKVVVDIPTIEVNAEFTKEKNKHNTQMISMFSTNVADSTGGRKSNVKLALSKFDGMIIKNGESISFNKVTGPHTLDNGYKTATIIYNSRFVEGVGGGVCQASTTLYNALLRANIQVDEVNKHTLPVKYVPLALDAMVSEYISDLRFTNNTGSDIYIKTYSDENSVTVEIYGKPNDEGYTYDTRSETIQIIAHTGDIIKQDVSREYSDKVLFQGEYFRLTYPREGYEAISYLQTYKNGVLVDERQIRHEIYKPQNGIVIEGVEEVPAGMTAIDTGVDIIEGCSECINAENMQGAIPTAYCP